MPTEPAPHEQQEQPLSRVELERMAEPGGGPKLRTYPEARVARTALGLLDVVEEMGREVAALREERDRLARMNDAQRSNVRVFREAWQRHMGPERGAAYTREVEARLATETERDALRERVRVLEDELRNVAGTCRFLAERVPDDLATTVAGLWDAVEAALSGEAGSPIPAPAELAGAVDRIGRQVEALELPQYDNGTRVGLAHQEWAMRDLGQAAGSLRALARQLKVQAEPEAPSP